MTAARRFNVESARDRDKLVVDSSAGTTAVPRPCPPWQGGHPATRRAIACVFASGRTCNLSEIPTGSKGRTSQPRMVEESSGTDRRRQGGGRRFDDGFTIRNGGAGFAGVFADLSGNRHRIARRSVPPPARRGRAGGGRDFSRDFSACRW